MSLSKVKHSPQVVKTGLKALSTSSVDQRTSKMDVLTGAARMAKVKHGPGYRSSFSGMVATVFGASGCVGKVVCNRLGKHGSQIILPYRGDHYKYMRFKVCGDLGQVLFTPFELNDEESIRKAMKHSNVVINLIGREWGTKSFSLEDVNVTGPARIARIAREMGIERFVHISAINARQHPNTLFMPHPSDFLITKWRGEQAVLNEFPDATIFRPTDVYGMDDTFLNYHFCWFRRAMFKKFAFWKKGEETIKAPLHASDLASGIMNSLDDPLAKGTIFEAYGPHRYLLSDLADWMALQARMDPVDYRYRRVDLRMAPSVFAKAFVSENLPIGTKWLGSVTLDRLERSNMSDEILGLPNLLDLGVEPASVVKAMPFEIIPHSAFQSYLPDVGEIPPIPDPPPLSRVQERKILEANKTSIWQSLGLA